MGDQFQDDIDEMRETGILYQQVADQFGDRIELIYVDPRNAISIIDYMLRQLRKKKIGLRIFLKNTFWGSRRGAIFLNGHWLNQEFKSKEDLLGNIQQELGVKG